MWLNGYMKIIQLSENNLVTTVRHVIRFKIKQFIYIIYVKNFKFITSCMDLNGTTKSAKMTHKKLQV